MAMVQFVPVRPFILRAGVGGGLGGDIEGNGMNLEAGPSLATTLGLGMAVPFPGLHFVVAIDNRRSAAGSVDFGEGTSGALRSSAWLTSIWVVF